MRLMFPFISEKKRSSFFNQKIEIFDVKLKVYPEFLGKYYQATKFTTSIKINVGEFQLSLTSEDLRTDFKMVKVTEIELNVHKNEQKLLDKQNFETHIKVHMKVL